MHNPQKAIKQKSHYLQRYVNIASFFLFIFRATKNLKQKVVYNERVNSLQDDNKPSLTLTDSYSSIQMHLGDVGFQETMLLKMDGITTCKNLQFPISCSLNGYKNSIKLARSVIKMSDTCHPILLPKSIKLKNTCKNPFSDACSCLKFIKSFSLCYVL